MKERMKVMTVFEVDLIQDLMSSIEQLDKEQEADE